MSCLLFSDGCPEVFSIGYFVTRLCRGVATSVRTSPPRRSVKPFDDLVHLDFDVGANDGVSSVPLSVTCSVNCYPRYSALICHSSLYSDTLPLGHGLVTTPHHEALRSASDRCRGHTHLNGGILGGVAYTVGRFIVHHLLNELILSLG